MIAPHSPMRAKGLTPKPASLPASYVWCPRCATGGPRGWSCSKCASTTATITAIPFPSSRPGLANEVALATALTDAGLVGWEPQFYWALSERTENGKPRQYHSDLAYPKAMLLVECEGQVHAIRRQRDIDCRRASLAAALGYRMVRVTQGMIEDGSAVELVRRALGWVTT